MIDRERLIKAWGIFRDSNPYQICDGKEFRAIKEPEYCMGQMIEDTIALLNDRKKTKALPIMGTTICECYNCKRLLAEDMNYCPVCGYKISEAPWKKKMEMNNDIEFEEPLRPVWKRECINTKVDMVEVVRCKDCVLRFTEKCALHDQAFPINKGNNWFCADGKRGE